MNARTAEGGYLHHATIAGDTVAFVCEDELWTVPADGGTARRLTAGSTACAGPRLSPDGRRIAFTGTFDGLTEVCLTSVSGGPVRRLTYQAGRCAVAGWHPLTGEVLYASTAGQPEGFGFRLFAVHADGGPPRLIEAGPAAAVSYGPGGGCVIGRSIADPARRKRYRGGAAGELWVDADGTGDYRRLDLPAGNQADPCWVGDRIYFISDHEGIGNVYSCHPDGTGLTRHTDHDEFYARGLSTDGRRLVYHSGAVLHVLDPARGGSRPLPTDLAPAGVQHQRRIVSATGFLDGAHLNPDGTGLAITARGKAFTLAPWSGPVRRHGRADGVRYRLLNWLADGERLVAVAGDDGPGERLALLPAEGGAELLGVSLTDLGYVTALAASPATGQVAFATNRQELWSVDTDRPRLEPRLLDTSAHERIEDLAWSPDGRWLAYTYPDTPRSTAIKVAEVDTGQTFRVTRPVLRDALPCFDPLGRYLYFVGQRDLTPEHDQVQFEIGFPFGARPYAVPLTAGQQPPFVTPGPSDDAGGFDGLGGLGELDVLDRRGGLDPLDGLDGLLLDGPGAPDAADGPDGEAYGDGAGYEDGDQEHGRVAIDFEGIERRLVPLPVPEGRYATVLGLPDCVLLLSVPLSAPEPDDPPQQQQEGSVTLVDLATGDVTEEYLGPVDEISTDRAGTSLLYRHNHRLRVVPAGAPKEAVEDFDTPIAPPGRPTGWIDLDRVKIPFVPAAEWRQMFREAWRLQRESFWNADMSGIDWDAVHSCYLPLLDRVATRAELSDLVWELHGELATSHAYERGGDYGERGGEAQGFLGVDWVPAPEADGRWRIAQVLRGDPWNPDATSPCDRPGVDIRAGDEIAAVDGRPVGPGGPAELLTGLAGREVELTVLRYGARPRRVVVRAARSEARARYLDWVARNSAYVDEVSHGRLAYLHVPDMFRTGYADFVRQFLGGLDREGLVVDVRYNGGGHVSPLLLDRLARSRTGAEHGRWSGAVPYPLESPRGPMAALINEQTGSDGEIFGHMFRERGLGTLVGTRTWGGTIATWPRHGLVDGTVTTQPEFCYYFRGVGAGLENRGVEPDITVSVVPAGPRPGLDAQLATAVSHLLTVVAGASPSPGFGEPETAASGPVGVGAGSPAAPRTAPARPARTRTTGSTGTRKAADTGGGPDTGGTSG
ncbi:tricorn protease [Actinacidiphila alni]|uniref:Tricorn protease homolog n=1 Tax=Actinacidiphila alni TaxID=380248 RepID=A0A1I2EBS5_9ACTN|nr:S41 family peptidase [Actinacidiphila alni]SFE90103.1 tricorn protease [Actinacidiphila alni]